MGAVTAPETPSVRRRQDREWQLHARCRYEDPGLFFHPDGERGWARKNRQQRARAICAACPVARECGEYSISFQEAFGSATCRTARRAGNRRVAKVPLRQRYRPDRRTLSTTGLGASH
jgi:WhiB family redox-sensing transcriptional regulator